MNGISPDDATNKAHESMMLDIDIAENRKNKIVNYLTIGDSVRKNILFNDKNSKGIDLKWSGSVFRVIKSIGNTITLNDDSKFKRMFLLKVSEDTKDYGENVITEAKRINKEINEQSKIN